MNVFYLPELDVIAIAEIKERQPHLLDLFSQKEQNLDDVIQALNDGTIDTVQLGFAPIDSSSYEIVPIDEKTKDEMLFAEADKNAFFDENRLIFPLLSQA